MIITAVSAQSRIDEGNGPDGPVRLAAAMVDGLAGRPADRHRVLDGSGIDPGRLDADLLIVSAAVHNGVVAADLVALLKRADLTGCVTFLATVGPWPADGGTGDTVLRPLLIRSGARCPAPTLHVSDVRSAAIGAFCRFWAPSVPSLVGPTALQAVPA